MEINEFDLLEPAQGLSAGREPIMYKELTPAEKVTLANWYGSASYNVFVKLAEGEIEKFETHHLQNWKDREYFDRTGLIAVAIRVFFERLQKEFNHQMDEFSGEIEFAKQNRLTEHTLKQSPESMILGS